MQPIETIQEFHAKRRETLDFLQNQINFSPEYLIILGTGLGRLVEEIDIVKTISYEDIPHFPHSTVEYHAGKLLIGTLMGKKVMAMQGRFHYYEGYSMQQIVYPVRVAFAMGAHTLIVSNACGGMNPFFRRGDVMCINDHINLLGDNPLIGPNDDTLGERFPDMSEPYTKSLIALATDVALEEKIKMHEGVFIAVTGPTFETRAEYRFLRQIGGDVVGMSTVPEVIAAVHMGMKALGISVITDIGFPDNLQPVDMEHVLEAANIGEPKMTAIIKGVLKRL